MTEVLPEAPHSAAGQQTPTFPAVPPHVMPTQVAPAQAAPALAAPAIAPAASHALITPAGHGANGEMAHRGREELGWGKEVWDRLDHAVRKECERTRVAAKYLPIHRVAPHTTSVASDIVTPVVTNSVGNPGANGAGGDVFAALRPAVAVLAPPPAASSVLRWRPPSQPPPAETTWIVDEGATTRLIEFWVEFSLTPQQVEYERNLPHHQHGAVQAAHPGHSEHALPGSGQHDPHGHSQHDLHGHGHHQHPGLSTALILATRAANILAQAEDMLIFNGLGAFTSPLYANFVRWRASGEPADWGLLDVVPSFALPSSIAQLPASQIIKVDRKPPPSPSLYAENTFGAVAQAYSVLEANGQYGPFALTLHNVPYADSFAPLPDTLIMPADRIRPLMTAGYWDSGTLDAPGRAAADAGAAAAAGIIAGGGTPAQAQQAAANAAAAYVISYGAALASGLDQDPTKDTALAAAAKAASLAAQAAGAVQPNADNLGEGAAYQAAFNVSPNYPGLPQGGAPTPVAPFGPPAYYGSLVSLGSSAMDLVVGIDANVGFMQQDTDGSFRFRVSERLALRIMDLRAVTRLEFTL